MSHGSHGSHNTSNLTEEQKRKLALSNAPIPIWANIICGSFAGSVAEALTIPLDTAKVRLQIQGQKKGKPDYVQKYNNMSHTLKTIAAEEGFGALFKGIVAGLQRQIIFAGIKIGFYPYMREFYMKKFKEQEVSFLTRVLAAMTTGAIGITVACPTDVVKIRLQAEGRKPAGTPLKYTGAMDAYSKIIAQEG